MTRREALLAGAALAAGTIGAAEPPASRQPGSTRSRFVPPDAEQRRKAVGSLSGLSPEFKRAFAPTEQFEPLPAPGPGDWLTEHQEPGQTFDQFAASKFNRPDSRRSTIYLAPLGDFDPDWSPDLSHLAACTTAFFQTTVKVLAPRPFADLQITMREKEGKRQYLTRDFLQALPKLLPADGYAILGVTMDDLYPDPTWNYVFGQASLRDRVGIYSFARYDPLFWREPRTPAARQLLIVRSLGVLLHETCHMYGLKHCIFYRCVLNGSNSLEESDRTPLHLCPVCLRKLQHAAGFNIITRYAALQREYRRLNVNDEAEWLESRLKFVRGT